MSRALLVHPWIHDFAAYDLWLRPLGLLQIAAFLREVGVQVDLVDCLDPHHPSVGNSRLHRRPFGQGRFHKEEIPKPQALSWFPRRYSRYGIPPSALEADLRKLSRPDVVLMTSGMTYWYPGVQETMAHCRRVFPDVPVVLGGIYATLAHDHAVACSGADAVVRGGDWSAIRQALSSFFSIPRGGATREAFPAWDLAPRTRGIVVKTSKGCPFHCSYCASSVLFPEYGERSPESVVREIDWAVETTAARDVAFYDDALLWNAGCHLIPILHQLSRRRIALRFHCPNGLHARFITPELARILKEHRFATLRLGFESASQVFHDRMDRKLSAEEFRAAIERLGGVGYELSQIGAYVMAGLPGQTIQDVERSVEYVLSLGARPHLAEYSPIPGTPLWSEAVERSPFPLEEDPLFHNNTILPCRSEALSYEALLRLKSSLHRGWQKGGL